MVQYGGTLTTLTFSVVIEGGIKKFVVYQEKHPVYSKTYPLTIAHSEMVAEAKTNIYGETNE